MEGGGAGRGGGPLKVPVDFCLPFHTLRYQCSFVRSMMSYFNNKVTVTSPDGDMSSFQSKFRDKVL